VMARPGWKRSKPFHNDEARDCDHDLPPWKEREITKPPWKARNPHERLERDFCCRRNLLNKNTSRTMLPIQLLMPRWIRCRSFANSDKMNMV
jgi:hypothetical protein